MSYLIVQDTFVDYFFMSLKERSKFVNQHQTWKVLEIKGIFVFTSVLKNVIRDAFDAKKLECQDGYVITCIYS